MKMIKELESMIQLIKINSKNKEFINEMILSNGIEKKVNKIISNQKDIEIKKIIFSELEITEKELDLICEKIASNIQITEDDFFTLKAIVEINNHYKINNEIKLSKDLKIMVNSRESLLVKYKKTKCEIYLIPEKVSYNVTNKTQSQTREYINIKNKIRKIEYNYVSGSQIDFEVYQDGILKYQRLNMNLKAAKKTEKFRVIFVDEIFYNKNKKRIKSDSWETINIFEGLGKLETNSNIFYLEDKMSVEEIESLYEMKNSI